MALRSIGERGSVDDSLVGERLVDSLVPLMLLRICGVAEEESEETGGGRSGFVVVPPLEFETNN